ncbi:TraB/GumN family protein [Aquabacterium sp. A7-Y]|uniref:TraB/GumN family protein n=1 Tax=Aquabacterium sp. A7-Y TaxID=1349605 RepID=UPI00223D7047|nr:TraB/GumN family protein [Aquabacterium sp. A7-Y]MCW7540226.1 TraB/GumN family protein [Aquabacterium sp. A7-Y]
MRIQRTWRRAAAAALLLIGAAWQAQAGDAAPPPATPAAAPGGRACPPDARPPTEAEMRSGMAAARDRGFLWRIERDGRTSWLYGTIHLGRPDWIYPGPALRTALQGSRQLAMELDLSDPAVLEKLRQPPSGPAPALTAALQQRLSAQAADACLPEAQLAALHPVLQVVTLTVLAGRRDGLHPAWAQESALLGWARQLKRPVTGLETPELQQAALIPDDPADSVVLLEQGLSQLEDGRARSLLLRLASAWERGDLDELASYEQWCDCMNTAEERATVDALLGDRNPAMAERIAALHAQGEVLAAVGALHMTGDRALPVLLQKKGFRVERVVFPRAGAARAGAPGGRAP